MVADQFAAVASEAMAASGANLAVMIDLGELRGAKLGEKRLAGGAHRTTL
jgi:hypothetical protein